MAKLTWDEAGQRLFETGVKNGVLYTYNKSTNQYNNGVAWNGLTAVTASPEGAEANALYADDMKYLNLLSVEEFKATIEAYTYPDQFAACDGSAELEVGSGIYIGQQARTTFGLAYRTALGNDTEGSDHSYKLHLIYGCFAAPSERAYETINDSPDAITFSWEVSTTPVEVSGFKPTATVDINSKKVNNPAKMATFEAILYGAPAFSASSKYAINDTVEYTNKLYRCKTAITTPGAWDASKWDEISGAVGPRLPMPSEIATIFA